MRYAPALTIIAVAFAYTAIAHNTSQSFEKIVGDYVIDIGYDADPIEAEYPVAFDFILRGLRDPLQEIEYSDAWVQIKKDGTIVFATGIHKPLFGGTSLLFPFPSDGEYELSVGFDKNSMSLAEASFPLTVLPSAKGDSQAASLRLAIIFFVGVLAGAGSAVLLRKRN